MALSLTGAVAVPLQTSAPLHQLHPILARDRARAILSSVDHLDDAVELALTAHTPKRLVVFDYHPQVDDHREALESAAARLADRHVTVETLDDVIDARRTHTDGPQIRRGDADDPASCSIYTSGSTGTPKGAMYTDHLMANCWRGWVVADWDTDGSCRRSRLNFMPISHVMGRVILYSTLGAGGTAYFTARSDLSTLLDDLALVRPTKLDLVPRIWEMLFQEVQSEVDRRCPRRHRPGRRRGSRSWPSSAQNLIGGRQFSATTGSAPISPELRSWVEEFLDIHLIEVLRLDRGRRRPGRRPDPAPTGDRLQAGRRAGPRLLRHRSAASAR